MSPFGFLLLAATATLAVALPVDLQDKVKDELQQHRSSKIMHNLERQEKIWKGLKQDVASLDELAESRWSHEDDRDDMRRMAIHIRKRANRVARRMKQLLGQLERQDVGAVIAGGAAVDRSAEAYLGLLKTRSERDISEGRSDTHVQGRKTNLDIPWSQKDAVLEERAGTNLDIPWSQKDAVLEGRAGTNLDIPWAGGEDLDFADVEEKLLETEGRKTNLDMPWQGEKQATEEAESKVYLASVSVVASVVVIAALALSLVQRRRGGVA